MAAPTLRGQTAAVAGLTTTSPSSTEVGDLVIVYTFERLGTGSASTLTVDGSMGRELCNHFHNDGSTDGSLGVACVVATVAGAQSYQGFTSSVGTETWTGCSVVTKTTFNATLSTIAVSTPSTQTTNAVPDPPSVTLGATFDWRVFIVSAWRLASAATVTPTHSAYGDIAHISGSETAELAIASLAALASASTDPGAWGDDVAPTGTCSFTFGVRDSGAGYISSTAESSNTFVGTDATPTIGFVQGAGTSTSGGTSGTHATASNVTSGNLLVIPVYRTTLSSDAMVVGDISQSAGTATLGSFALDVGLNVDMGGEFGHSAIFSCIVTGTGSCTIQVASGTQLAISIGVAEFSSATGWDSSRLEDTSTNNDLASSTPSSGDATSAGWAVFVGVTGNPAFDNPFTMTVGADYLLIDEEENGDTTRAYSSEYRIVSAGTTDAADWTLEGSTESSSVLAVYKPAAASSSDAPFSSTGESVATLSGASTAESPISSVAESVATLAGASTATADISSIAESVNTLAGASTAEAPISSVAESVVTLSSESTASGAIVSTAESVVTLDGASTAEAPITASGEAVATLDGASTAEAPITSVAESVTTFESEGVGTIESGDISMIGESVATLDGASTAEAPITAAGESVATLEGASIAEAPITSAGEAIATIEGASIAEAPITSAGESVVTVDGASTAEAVITSTGESVVTYEGTEVSASATEFAISISGESVTDFSSQSTAAGAMFVDANGNLIMVPEDDEVYRPAWIYGTSRAKLKNPWGKKRRKQIEENDDDEVLEIARILLLRLHQNRRAAGISIRTSSSSRVGVPASPEVRG